MEKVLFKLENDAFLAKIVNFGARNDAFFAKNYIFEYNFSMKFGVFEDSPLAVRLCIFLKIRIILVKMVLSIVFVFLSAEDFPIFLFSKINRSLSNIFKSMNRLLSLPTKIQIKNENTKNRSKDAEFSVKNVFLLHHLGTFFDEKLHSRQDFCSKDSNFRSKITFFVWKWIIF